MRLDATSQTEQQQYAGLGRRFVALVVDFIALSTVFFPVTRAVKGVWLMSSGDHLWTYGWLVTDPLCLIFLVVMVAYFVILEGTCGATIGKLLLRLRVVAVGGDKPGIVRAVIRNLLRAVDTLPAFCVLGVVLISRSPEKARLGDRIAGTRVVVRSRY